MTRRVVLICGELLRALGFVMKYILKVNKHVFVGHVNTDGLYGVLKPARSMYG